MTPYRKQEPRESDLEIDAIVDQLARIKQLRKRVALPCIIAALIATWFGMAAHATGRWSVLGTTPDGTYFVNAVTLGIAAATCAAPIAVPGVAVYIVLRARLRRSWREDHAAKGVSASFLEESSGRFG